jgi:preprotein translocase subunit SecA
LGYRIFENCAEKNRAIIADAVALSDRGRAVLIGVKSVLTSDELADEFKTHAPDLPIEILNAINDADEAAIIARAGHAGAVTVATNMAGRGTDIKIPNTVKTTGGLHVIIAETNDFSRIDRQLIGRSARQGDPGTFIRYVAMDEDVVVRFLPNSLIRLWKMIHRLGFVSQKMARFMIYLAQTRAEHLAYKQRKSALKSEIDMEKSMI